MKKRKLKNTMTPAYVGHEPHNASLTLDEMCLKPLQKMLKAGCRRIVLSNYDSAELQAGIDDLKKYGRVKKTLTGWLDTGRCSPDYLVQLPGQKAYPANRPRIHRQYHEHDQHLRRHDQLHSTDGRRTGKLLYRVGLQHLGPEDDRGQLGRMDSSGDYFGAGPRDEYRPVSDRDFRTRRAIEYVGIEHQCRRPVGRCPIQTVCRHESIEHTGRMDPFDRLRNERTLSAGTLLENKHGMARSNWIRIAAGFGCDW